MPFNISTLKRKPNEEEDVLTKQRNEAMLHMARLAHERMQRIDEEDRERGMKEQQYNNSVKYQRMVEYELNNPGETATGVLEYEAIFKRSRGRRVKRKLLREAVANGEMEHVPRSLRPKKHVLRKPDPSKIVYNRFTPAVQREIIERELKSKSTLTDIMVGMVSKSKSRRKSKPSTQGRGGESELGDSRGRDFEEDYGYYGSFSYPDFREYELEDARRNSFAQRQSLSVSSLDGVLEEIESQLADIEAEKRRAGGVEDAVVECVALEDLPAVIQTIAIAREDARLGFEDEMGYGTQEIKDVAPMLVDLFHLAQVLAQEAL